MEKLVSTVFLLGCTPTIDLDMHSLQHPVQPADMNLIYLLMQ